MWLKYNDINGKKNFELFFLYLYRENSKSCQFYIKKAFLLKKSYLPTRVRDKFS